MSIIFDTAQGSVGMASQFVPADTDSGRRPLLRHGMWLIALVWFVLSLDTIDVNGVRVAEAMERGARGQVARNCGAKGLQSASATKLCTRVQNFY